jgi:DNA-binding protein H-NS
MSIYRELKQQMADLEARIEKARADELDDAVTRCKAIIDEYGLTAWDLGLVKTQMVAAKRGPRTFKPKDAGRRVVPPMYRDPATGATWSGRGRTPHWIAGHDRDEFLIGRAA